MIHGLFYKRWIKTDLDYYKWHWSKILECSGPTDEEDKQHAFQKHRNLHRLVQEGTPWNSIYCFLICSLNSLSFMTFISNPTNYINQYSPSRPAQRAVWGSRWRCALCGRSTESPCTQSWTCWCEREEGMCHVGQTLPLKNMNTIEKPGTCSTSEELLPPQERWFRAQGHCSKEKKNKFKKTQL